MYSPQRPSSHGLTVFILDRSTVQVFPSSHASVPQTTPSPQPVVRVQADVQPSQFAIDWSLPGTRIEAEVLKALVPSHTALQGKDATERRLERMAGAGELKRFRLLHLATNAGGALAVRIATRRHGVN